MNKKLLALIATAIVVTSTVTGGTMAVYQAYTKTDKTISTSSLAVKLNIDGNTDEQGNVIFSSDDIVNGKVREKVSAVNSGDKEEYVRVRVNKAWYDGNEKVFTKNEKEINSKYIGINTCNTNDWIVLKDEYGNDEDIYIYYKKALKPGATTSTFMDAFTVFENISENTNEYSGLSVKIRFDADAVQGVAASEAMLSEWGVKAVLDNNGNIISLSNQ